jgi:hypothetical protein
MGAMRDKLGNYDLALLGSVITISAAAFFAPLLGQPGEQRMTSA